MEAAVPFLCLGTSSVGLTVKKKLLLVAQIIVQTCTKFEHRKS